LELLYVCQAIETKQHRVREKKWGARTIDLDIITYGVQVIASKQLIVPHPEMMNRGFAPPLHLAYYSMQSTHL
jgi:2-amino-4-hydroxy-6-hydroxymethyldihydropteridine diphosphokinase